MNRFSLSLCVALCGWIFALAGCDLAPYLQDAAKLLPAESPSSDGSAVASSSEAPSPTAQPPISRSSASQSDSPLTICSFNVQFLGNSRSRDDEALVRTIADHDIVVVQELVSPPYAGAFPDGTPFKPDPESAEWFEAMKRAGFEFVLSEEDTGSGEQIHRNGSSTEWWVAFYKPDRVRPAPDLPNGFLADDRSDHENYERVPYAFGFRTPDGGVDFVLVSVHLKPGGSSKDKARRKQELDAIAAWIKDNSRFEKDFIILGDMNIEDAEELANATPEAFVSLNDECRPTNTNVNGPKPYDHVMYHVTHSQEIDTAFDFKVVDLTANMRSFWSSTAPYPGDPYDHNEFRKHYSDHHPVVFRINVPDRDDDGSAITAGRTSNTVDR